MEKNLLNVLRLDIANFDFLRGDIFSLRKFKDVFGFGFEIYQVEPNKHGNKRTRILKSKFSNHLIFETFNSWPKTKEDILNIKTASQGGQ